MGIEVNPNNLSLNEKHTAMVLQLAKPGEDVAASMTAHKANILHMAVGISGEAGELLDAVKKAVIYNKALDVENVIEEIGDLEFYLSGLREALYISRDSTLIANMQKLSKRYSDAKYSDAQAQERADKK
jgi:NTP pyrophosphatase (non-canonical NTP hydrolase)